MIVKFVLATLATLASASERPSQSPQATPTPTPAAVGAAKPPTAAKPGGAKAGGNRFLDEITVSATLNPSLIRETPGTVSVVEAETIERRLIENAADLVKFEPGIYVESNLARVGLNGFNVRGIGGNRVMTQVDGVETSEQFDFGPFNVHQFGLDLDTLKSAEIVRSAGSSLYGSDALGGVVSFFTKDPADYLGDRGFHIGAKTLFDGRSRDGSGNVVIAGGRARVKASLFGSFGLGHEPRNRGEIESEDVGRTALNPQDRRSSQALGKIVAQPTETNTIRAAFEVSDSVIDTDAYSLRTVTVQGPSRTTIPDITSEDRMMRRRASVDQVLVNRGGFNQINWSVYAQSSETNQIVDEVRVTTGVGPATTINRSGTLDYEQDSLGGALSARKTLVRGSLIALLTAGGSYKRHVFDMLRDRIDINAASGAVVPTTALILPSKYFPKSVVGESGGYLQAEIRVGRLNLVPGLRYDRFTLDADATDQVFVATLSPAAADFNADAFSTRLGASVKIAESLTAFAQFAKGFRAPPYSAVNSGFTNLLGGYTSIPNSSLNAETSDNLETGLRVSLGSLNFGATVFQNSYRDFIDQVQRGINTSTRLLEFQYQNVSRVRIEGIELKADARVSDHLRFRASYTLLRGENRLTSVPLASLSPDQGVAGLEYAAAGNRFGGEFSVRSVRAQDPDRAGASFFAPDAFSLFDATGWFTLPRSIRVRAGLLNIGNRKYFEWANVRGRQSADPTLDRYSSPGISAIASVSVGW